MIRRRPVPVDRVYNCHARHIGRATRCKRTVIRLSGRSAVGTLAGMHDDPVAAARRLVEDRFPAARWAMLTGPDEHTTRLQAHCADVLAAGPRPLTADQLNMLRGLADLSDDLVHAAEPVEAAATAAMLWQAVADAACATARPPHWRGTGKWRARELLDLDAAYAARWLAARHDPQALLAMAAEQIAATGGPLVDRFRVGGERGGAAVRR
ncbi:hypothetical protein Cch02nite_47460 [Catellatospora chokoriensis]|uniref:Uncharacterized protein n=2 Tax=Catellatospora chokoriensis TaxID=310353 RepID=A0A8J3NSR7_9ACTN|nr:hypothetical protein Cch02nite_47460 [Catellatospora chokoriensis]